MASVSLQSRLTLNCKLSGRTKSGSALTVGIVPAQGSRKVAPSGGGKIIFDDFTGDKTMASVSLQSRLTLNSRLSIKKPAHKARVSLVMKLF